VRGQDETPRDAHRKKIEDAGDTIVVDKMHVPGVNAGDA